MTIVLLSLLIASVITGVIVLLASKSGGSTQYVPVHVRSKASERALEDLNYRDNARYMNQMIDRMQSENKNIRDRQDRN
jgi:hypothetical protein